MLRLPAVDEGNTAADCKQVYQPGAAADWAGAWQGVLFDLIAALPPAVTSQVAAVAFDGTSSTSLLVDAATGRVLAAPKLYDEAQGPEAVQAAKVGLEGGQGRALQAALGVGRFTVLQVAMLLVHLMKDICVQDLCCMQLPTSQVPTLCVCLLCLQAIAPASHTATAATSTLCKVLTWHLGHTWQDAAAAGATPRLMHQADWLAYLLHGEWGQMEPQQA